MEMPRHLTGKKRKESTLLDDVNRGERDGSHHSRKSNVGGSSRLTPRAGLVYAAAVNNSRLYVTALALLFPLLHGGVAQTAEIEPYIK